MKEELKKVLNSLLGDFKLNGDEIVFYLNGKEVGRNILPTNTYTKVRHVLAEDCGVEEYNDFHLVRKNGEIVKGSERMINDLLGTVDIHKDFGTFEGEQYKQYKDKKTCSTCGGITYSK